MLFAVGALGSAFTVIVYSALSVHPAAVVTVQVIFAVPAATPVTTPEATVAMPVLPLVHVTEDAVTLDV
jgi:hypothetical protein